MTLTGTTNLFISDTNNPSYFYLGGTNAEMFVDGGPGGYGIVVINRNNVGSQSKLSFSTTGSVQGFISSSSQVLAASDWSMGTTNGTTGGGNASDFRIAQGDIYNAVPQLSIASGSRYVGINKASANTQLDVNGNFLVTGSISATGDVIAYSSSDSRLKENVLTISGSLDILKQIGGYTFDWIPTEGIHQYEGHDIGVIAQEIEAVLPELVITRDNGYKAVKYEKMVALLIETNKELLKRIEALEAKIK